MANLEHDATVTDLTKELRCKLRQGNILPREVAVDLKLIDRDEVDVAIIVASHDCDCVQNTSTEPYIEVMKAKIVNAADGNYTNGKNPRILHLAADYAGNKIVLEIPSSPKNPMLKQTLLEVSPDEQFAIPPGGRRTFSIWLRTRYHRPAWPDALMDRLRDVKVLFEKAGKSNPYALHGIYIYYDPQNELGPEDIYEIQIRVIYDQEIQGAKEVAIDAAQKIQRKFAEKFQTLNGPDQVATWSEIYLSECDAIADTEFSFADALSFDRYQLDHLSLRHEPQAEIPDFGS